ncbi:FtsX-like permease family protein [Pseudoflavitalea sp. X16]|uniref:ABC transporter permease n=1 Tax=Paraflavitalea devenefica TaxID=2716334 RepID=UPI0014218B5D|nr:ABC transporter permease [Paraflavitalea devenefica]NII28016.1 FtsX-like permease family protein [Paraflavitalea devenefica]
MIKNYILLAWRNLIRHKTFSIINILGLSAGIAFVFLIGAYIWGELRVNNSIPDNDRVFILQSKWQKADMGMSLTTPAPLAKALRENFPDLVADYYHHDGISSIVSKGNKYFREGLQPGDASFLTMTGFPLLYGDARTAFNNPNAVVLTAAKARKYFGRADVIGETLTFQSFAGTKQDFIITGVLKDLPYNTVTNFTNTSNEIFLPTESLRFFGRYDGFQAWPNVYIVNYVKLQAGVQPADLQKPIQQLLKLNASPEIAANLQVQLVPLNEYYLQLNNGLARRMVYTLSFVALFILLMAVINFINITVGNSTTRLKEIGVRKVMGGSRQQLIGQFLIESIVLALISVILALGIYQWAIPFCSKMLGRPLPSLTALPLQFMLIPVLMALVTGTLAGLYPAFILSLQPSVDSLKGKLKTVKEKVAFRRSLVALQFTTAIVVFVGAIVVDKQLSFSFNSSLGYDKEQVITAAVPRDWTVKGVQHMEMVRDEMATLPAVSSASFSYEIPDGMSGNDNMKLYKAAEDSSRGINVTGLSTDDQYATTYKLQLAAGKFLERDTTALVINEKAARALGWNDPHAALGQNMRFQGSQQRYTIAGVVKDFHFTSKHEAIGPMAFLHVKNTLMYRYLSFKVKPGNMPETLAALEKKWAAVMPGAPFDYKFIDDTLGFMYRSEIQLKKAAQMATLLSLVIVLLGVFGIVALNISRRMKEVGIRKVLGASGWQIITLFLKEFAWMILLANLIAWPLAYLVLENWLSNFVYRIHINWIPFATVALVIAALITVMVTIQTFVRALNNPVRNLRSE